MPESLFADSWARLRWVEQSIARIKPLVDAINAEARAAPLELLIESHGEYEHARFRLAQSVPVPEELGFAVADIAVNARSCLDMAIQAIVDHNHLPVSMPMFPIEDDITKKLGQKTRDLFKALSPELVDALRPLQPRYSMEAFGNFDIPLNNVALMIREISNTNKHRNITPALRTAMSRGYSMVEGMGSLEMVSDNEPSPWPTEDATVLEVRYRPGEATEAQLLELRPPRDLRVMLHEAGLRYQETWEVPIDVEYFLTESARFVRNALDRIGEAHATAGL